MRASKVGALDAAEARELRKTGARREAQSRHSLRTALELRATLYRALAALAAGRAPDSADFGQIEIGIVKAVASAQLQPLSGVYGWTAADDDITPATPIKGILLSTLRLLQSADLLLLRECQRCSWLFIDRSKNHGRRWCRPQACGNRARVERHYRAHSM
jgi:predicted RNA-binding Zn ribbon-like protein